MWNLHYYGWAYVVAGVLALIPPLVLAFLNGAVAMRQWRPSAALRLMRRT
jgi:hypothetical protein